MKICGIYILAIMAFTSSGISRPTTEWLSLFDGKSTTNWTPRAEVETFEAKGEELHLFSKRNVWVISKQKMKNFEMECEVSGWEGGFIQLKPKIWSMIASLKDYLSRRIGIIFALFAKGPMLPHF